MMAQTSPARFRRQAVLVRYSARREVSPGSVVILLVLTCGIESVGVDHEVAVAQVDLRGLVKESEF